MGKLVAGWVYVVEVDALQFLCSRGLVGHDDDMA
jgi:hypothetical protein